MLILATPTYKVFDKCVAMIESAIRGSVVPDRILIMDNSAGKFYPWLQEHGIALSDRVDIITPEYNMGVGRAFNAFLRMVKDVDPTALLMITNDDIVFEENTIEAFVCAAVEQFVRTEEYDLCYCCGGVDAPNAFSLFMVHPETLLNTIGPFDETIYPAYFEDNDMHYRMKLAGFELTRLDCQANHGEGSATLKAFTNEETALHHHQFRRNQEYFVRKWGGLPGSEVYTTPFDGQCIMTHMAELNKRYGF